MFPRDVLGQEIAPGTIVTYATRRGSELSVRVAQVDEVIEEIDSHGNVLSTKFRCRSFIRNAWGMGPLVRRVVLREPAYITVVRPAASDNEIIEIAGGQP